MKTFKYLLISFFIIGLFSFSQIILVKAERPAYALSETDTFIVENDYELMAEETTVDGTVTDHLTVWIRPSSCYPFDPGAPPCEGAFAATYSADSNKDQYDESYYQSIRDGLSMVHADLTEITEDVPGAGIALLYDPTPDTYAAIAYFGYKTGISVVVAEYVSSGLSVNNYKAHGSYDKSGMKEIMVAIGTKASSVLDLDTKKGSGYTIMTLLIPITIATMVHLYKRKKE
jgi:hypothetical protein